MTALISDGSSQIQKMEHHEAESSVPQGPLNIYDRASRRFSLEKGESARVTFMDGNLTREGLIELWLYKEHFLPIPPYRFVCVAYNEECPICRDGFRAHLMGAGTIYDHRVNATRIFCVAYSSLSRMAVKAKEVNGLKGWTVLMTKTGNARTRIGDVMEFEGRMTDSELMAAYGRRGRLPTMNYAKHLGYLSAKELRKQGFGVIQGLEQEFKSGFIEAITKPFKWIPTRRVWSGADLGSQPMPRIRLDGIETIRKQIGSA